MEAWYMRSSDDAAPSEFTSPEALLHEEDSLVVGNLDERATYELGRSIADQALASRQPLSVSVWLEKREVFRATLPGSPVIGDVVLDAKYRTAARGGHSSLYERNVRLARGTTFEEETGLTFPEQAPFGGAVPVRSTVAGEIRGWVVVTGLTQEEDHATAVEAIRALARQSPAGGES